jgi:hypothetical protein
LPQSKKSAAEFMAMLKEYHECQKTEIALLAGQIAEAKTMLENASRKIKRLAALRGSATDNDEAEQYTADLKRRRQKKPA